jgi:hypothetical protein
VPTSSLTAALERTGAHDHLCSIYDRPEERFAVAVPYLRFGLERGDRCLYIANEGELHIVRREMEAGAIDVERSVSSGALILSTEERAYMKHGTFDPQKMFDFWRQCAGEALNDGYAALRAAGETDWVADGGPGLERWMEYESRLTEALRECKCLALCQYNRRLFPAELVLGVIRTHPVVIYGGTVAHNLYHVPPQDFLQENHIDREVERQLRIIQDREGARSALRRQQQTLEAKQNELRQTQKLLAGELSAMTGLHEMSTRLTSTRDARVLLMEMLDAAIALQGAHFGMIQLLDPEKQGLEVVVQRGFGQDFLDCFREGSIDAGSARGRAIAEAAGFRAVQSTPLVSSSGDVLGIAPRSVSCA